MNFAGLVMDVDRLAVQGAAKNNDREARINFVLTTGNRASAMEHIVPEQMFSTDQGLVQGVSAVKALAIAGAEGQRIWTIDQNNLSEALSAISLSSEIESEIRNAVLAGNVATVHEQLISFAGGTNTGYLLIDPDTGAGAYLSCKSCKQELIDGDKLWLHAIISGLIFGLLLWIELPTESPATYLYNT